MAHADDILTNEQIDALNDPSLTDSEALQQLEAHARATLVEIERVETLAAEHQATSAGIRDEQLRIRELEAEIERLEWFENIWGQQTLSEACSVSNGLQLEVRAIVADRDRLRAALEKYGDHINPCGRFVLNRETGNYGDCTCGYLDALAEQARAEEPAPHDADCDLGQDSPAGTCSCGLLEEPASTTPVYRNGRDVDASIYGKKTEPASVPAAEPLDFDHEVQLANEMASLPGATLQANEDGSVSKVEEDEHPMARGGVTRLLDNPITTEAQLREARAEGMDLLWRHLCKNHSIHDGMNLRAIDFIAAHRKGSSNEAM